MLVREHIDDNLYLELLNESLNEEFSVERIKEILSKISNKTEAASRLIKKFNETRSWSSKKYIATALALLFVTNFAVKNSRWSSSSVTSLSASPIPMEEVNHLALKIAKHKTISIDKIKSEIKPSIKTPDISNKLVKYKFIDVDLAHASDSAKNFIKHHEKLSLEAYAIGDGMITIGYGHASPERKSKWRVGDQITEQKAEELFEKDVIEAEEGVKRIIKSWKKPKIEAQITQGMFDAMVSMAYNMGITGLKNTYFMNFIRDGKFKEAGERLKITKITSKVKQPNGEKITVEMPGLKQRRMAEYNLFASK